mmetsp:Transcript_27005/g.61970  ORF Transcript_27005/g.61970 Transcript_27005/m.61970 type:complete len:242 (+) Transcript_27005:516-1241(+)
MVAALHQKHRCREQRTLPHEVDRVVQHGLEQVEAFPHRGARARDADSHRGAVPHVRVVRLGEQLDHLGRLRRRAREHEANRSDRRAAHVVGHVGHRHVQQPAEGGVRAGARVREGDGVHRAVPQDGVLVVEESGDEAVCLGLAAVHSHRQPECEAADDLLVRGVMRVPDHLLDAFGRRAAEHDQTHRKRRCLAGDGGVVEEHPLELLVQLVVLSRHRGDPDAERGAMLHRLIRPRVAQRLE